MMFFSNSYATIDIEAFPLVVITLAKQEPERQAIKDFLEALLSIHTMSEDRQQQHYVIFDCREVKYLNAEGRIINGQWTKEHRLSIIRNVGAAAYIIPNFLQKVLLNGIFLIERPAYPYFICDTPEKALAWLQSQMADTSTAL